LEIISELLNACNRNHFWQHDFSSCDEAGPSKNSLHLTVDPDQHGMSKEFNAVSASPETITPIQATGISPVPSLALKTSTKSRSVSAQVITTSPYKQHIGLSQKKKATTQQKTQMNAKKRKQS
jgi:hypothetical protein